MTTFKLDFETANNEIHVAARQKNGAMVYTVSRGIPGTYEQRVILEGTLDELIFIKTVIEDVAHKSEALIRVLDTGWEVHEDDYKGMQGNP